MKYSTLIYNYNSRQQNS